MLKRRELLKLLGTYLYKNFYDDRFVNGLLEGTLALHRQVETNLNELCASAYRKSIPIYHTEHVYTFFLDPKKRNETVSANTRFGDPTAYFLDPPTPHPAERICDRYGIPSNFRYCYALPLNNVISVEKIVDHPQQPTIELLPGRDFDLLKGAAEQSGRIEDAVRFYVDPCADGKSKEFFLINVRQDFKWIYKHFGYLLGLDSPSSKLYRDVVDDIFNAYIDGSSAAGVLSILAEVTGNIVSKQHETVHEITQAKIVTDHNIYELLPGHLSRVTVGETVSPGDSLTKEFSPIYINQMIPKGEWSAVLLPKQYLGPDYFYGIAFINADVPVTYADGKPRFYLGGNDHDIELFWEDFDKHCERLDAERAAKAIEDFLAKERESMDREEFAKFEQNVRENPENHIELESITREKVLSQCWIKSKLHTDVAYRINPYKFFTEHIGRYHYTLLALDHVKYPTALRLDQIPIRRLMPPWSALIIQQRTVLEDTIQISGVSNDDLCTNCFTLLEGGYKIKASANIYAGGVC